MVQPAADDAQFELDSCWRLVLATRPHSRVIKVVTSRARDSSVTVLALQTCRIQYFVLRICRSFFSLFVYVYYSYSLLYSYSSMYSYFSIYSYFRCTRILCRTRIRLSLYSYCKLFSKNTTRSFDAASFAVTALSNFAAPFKSPIFHREDSTVMGPPRFRSRRPLVAAFSNPSAPFGRGRVVALSFPVTVVICTLHTVVAPFDTRLGARLGYSPSLSFIL